MTGTPLPSKVSTTLVVALMLATGVLAAAAITTSMDTMVPLLRGEGWASGRGLSEQTVALTVEATRHDDKDREPFDTGNRDHETYPALCVPRDAPATDVTITVWADTNRTDKPIASGVTGAQGRLTFDLAPGHYEVEARHASWRPGFTVPPHPIDLDQDKLLWLQAAHNRSSVFAEPSPWPGPNGTGWHLSLTESLWTAYNRGTFVAAGAAHSLAYVPSRSDGNGTVRVVPEPDTRDDERAWKASFTPQSSARFRLPEGVYRINVTWSDGTSVETLVTLDRALLLQGSTATGSDGLQAGRMPEIRISSDWAQPCP